MKRTKTKKLSSVQIKKRWTYWEFMLGYWEI